MSETERLEVSVLRTVARNMKEEKISLPTISRIMLYSCNDRKMTSEALNSVLTYIME